MTQFVNIFSNGLALPWIVLLFICLVLTSGCASKTQYALPSKVPVQEASSDSDPANKLVNLSYDQLIAKADMYQERDNRSLAKLHYQKALGKDPDSLRALVGLSKVFIREGQLSEATKLLEKAIKKDDHYLPALLMLGVVARNQGDLAASLEWLTKAMNQSPSNPEILTELAITNDHIGQERLTYAEALYKKVISLQPLSSAAHNNLGFNNLLQGRHQDAAKSFVRALTLAPSNQRAKNNLGAAYLLNNQADEALKLFQDTVGLAAAYNNLGYIQMTRGNQREAEQAFKKALQLNPSFYVRAHQNLERLEHLNSSAR
ncbi:MAG: tetratricopeptide repeat protein [Syntrophotaleaceae bacterium]